MNSCPVQFRLEAYHDGELDVEQRRVFERHLARCAACARDLAWMQSVSAALAFDAAHDLTPDEAVQVHRAIDDLRAGERRSVFRTAVAIMAVAASILIVCLAWYAQLPAAAPRTSPMAQAGEPPAWERTAMTLRVDPHSADGDAEPSLADARLADWMLRGLSEERADER